MMRAAAIVGPLLAIAMSIAIAPSAPAAPPTAPLMPAKARLVAETAAVTPGTTLWVDLHFDITPGWHIYWRNPGDSGVPTEIAWKLPPGYAAGEIAWPVPERFVQGTIGNYGYAGATDLLVPIAVAKDAAPGGTAHLDADASWLVCSDICIPGEARLALDLPVKTAAAPSDATAAALFAAARERLPKAAGFAAHFAIAGSELRLFVPAAALAGIEQPQVSFFPLGANIIDPAAEPRQEPRADGVTLRLAKATGPAASLPRTLDGVLAVRGADGAERAYAITPFRSAAMQADDGPGVAWWQAVLLALLGGIALNLMPCVFPVLSLKVLGLASAAHRAEQRRHAIAFAAGVILSFTALGAALLLLRAGGAAIGWGFQLQSPVVVGLLAYLLLAMGLSLSGVAEFGAGLAGTGERLAGHGGIVGAFATGVLASVVATPCTAPFMGAALGFAVIAPAPAALAVFVALGCGLALPFALAATAPGIARLLPRPGSWMMWFKQALAFPLYATVAWLVWVLIQEVEPGDAFVALLGLVVVGFAVWLYGRTRLAEISTRRLGLGLAAAAVALAVGLAATLTPASSRPGISASNDGLPYEAFDTARLARLAAERRPVFVNLTAAWCITCLVNERATLDSATIRRAFADRRVVALKGDWTRRNPEITTFLQGFGRSGVPLYLLYDKSGAPIVLPQLLTEAAVLDALGKI